MTKNKFMLLVLLNALFVVSSSAQFQYLDQKIPHLMKEADIPGLSVAIIEGGKVVYGNAFGVRSADSNIPVDDRTVFDAASLGKPLLALAVLLLSDEGRFDLDKPLASYLEYEDLKQDPRYTRITARMVLSHTSGLPAWRNGPLNLVANPSETFHYSNEGFVFLQKVIERITGQSIENFVQQKVLKPLSMDRSSFVWLKEFEADYALPHNETGRPEAKYKPRDPNAAFSLQTTASDYSKLIIAILNGIGVRKAVIEQMLSPQIRVPDTENLSWGLGWGIQETSLGKSFFHWGDNGTSRCFAMAFPDRRSGMVFFTNSSNGLSILHELVKEVFGTNCPACQWMGYMQYNEPSFGLLKKILTQGFDLAMAPFMETGTSRQNKNLLSEQAMNTLGHKLLTFNRIEDAKRIFKMNMLAFPNSSVVYDSYGEALLRNGEYDLAKENYAKALQMNPGNKIAESVVRHLSGRLLGKTLFALEAYPYAKLVTLSGSFNNWNKISIPCIRRDGAWMCSIDLPPGKHFYKFVVDGVSISDPSNPILADDGSHSSVIEIKNLVARPATTPAASSPAKEAIARYALAMGGKEKWKEVKTCMIKMRNARNPGNILLTAYIKKPGKYRLDLDNPPNKMIKSYNGLKGVVSINYRTQDLSSGEQRELAEEADFFDELLFADEKGYTTELVGTEDLDGKKVVVIKMAKSKDDIQTYYLDAETYLPVMMTEYSHDENFKGVLFKNKTSDYRQVDGLMFPFYISQSANENVLWERIVEEIKINPRIEDKFFEVK